MPLQKLKPAVPKYWLIVLAGVMWSTVGVMLCRLAYKWLMGIFWSWAMALGFTGIVLAIIVYRFGFSKIVEKNIKRICLLSEKSCIFAFQEWKSYFIIAFMIILGITLRHSLFPKHYLAVIYTAIGGALFLSSFHYYRHLWRTMILKQPCSMEKIAKMQHNK